MKIDMQGMESERLRFRRVREEDFDLLLPLFQQEEMMEFINMHKIADPAERCRKWINGSLRVFNDNERGDGYYSIIDKLSNELVGQCGLLIQEVEGVEEVEVAYSVLPAFRGQGYATEAARRAREHAFEKGLSDSLISIVHVRNLPSAQVALNNGMHLDRENIELWSLPVNIYRIHKSRWTVV